MFAMFVLLLAVLLSVLVFCLLMENIKLIRYGLTSDANVTTETCHSDMGTASQATVLIAIRMASRWLC